MAAEQGLAVQDPLYKIFDNAKQGGFVQFDGAVPDHIATNLNEQVTLRPYQVEAINRYLYYMDTYPNRAAAHVNLLFNMATGSGKTLIMAALMLDLYKRGYNKFVFFVNRDNIVQKTIDNFTNSASDKYLFAQELNIDGHQPTIKAVDNLASNNKADIHILFTTIQKLHLDLLTPREQRITLEDLEETPLVMLSDEAHHINAWTLDTKLTEEEKLSKQTWERSVQSVFRQNPANLLLEFTATIDDKNPAIASKYNDVLLYKYDLRQFRNDKYSKEIILYSVDDDDIKNRMLHAVLISQYRRKVAEKHGIYLKPVILFKSRFKADSEANRLQFNDMIRNLQPSELNAVFGSGERALHGLAQYLSDNEVSPADFIAELKSEFSDDRIIDMNNEKQAKDRQLSINNLESRTNEYRVIFAVEKLNEGWDVLNLFDIVRLYKQRDGQYGRGGEYKPGKATISEAQLIGRGARYWPFTAEADQIRDQRKYDKDLDNELRIIEELYYHSQRDTDYLIELRTALTREGLMEDRDPITVTLKLKDSFMSSPVYQKGVVYKNKLVDNPRVSKQTLADYLSSDLQFTVRLDSHAASSQAAFEDQSAVGSVETKTVTKKIADIPQHIVRRALDKNYRFYGFANLQKYLPHLSTKDEFMQMLSGITIKLTGTAEALDAVSPDDYLSVVGQVLAAIKQSIESVDEPKVGTNEFEPVLIRDVFKPQKKIIVENAAGSMGVPMSEERNDDLRLDLTTRQWYAHTEDYGTGEEKRLVRYINDHIDELQAKWDEVFLIRNERDLKLYSFKDGSPFMPDYVMLLSSKDGSAASYQVFMEPKGAHIEAGDGWKEEFLLQMGDLATSEDGMVILGMPFYREETEGAFTEAFNTVL